MKATDNEVYQYLVERAELEGFYLFCGPGIRGALICYVDRNGLEWTLMEDNAPFIDVCIDFLKKREVPEFFEHVAEERHVKWLKEKYKKGSPSTKTQR